MKSPKTLAVILLALTTLGGAALAWRQYQELVELRAAALDRDERAGLLKRIADLERLNRGLHDQLAAYADNSDNMPGDAAGENNGGPRGGRGGPRGGFPGGRGGPGQQAATALRNLLTKPEVQALLSVQQKAAIDARYAALFKNLNLSPEQRAKFESTITEFQATRMDVMNAAQEQGIRDPNEIRKLMSDAQTEFSSNLKSVLGDSGFAQYQNYEQTVPQRNLVSQLQQRLSYTDTPLTQAQSDQLVQILASNAPPPPTNADGTPLPGRRGGGGGMPPPDGGDGGAVFGGNFALPLGGGPGGGPGGPGGGGPGGGGGLGIIGAVLGGDLGGGGGGGGRGGAAVATVTPAAVNQAQTVLAQPQLQVLQQIQQQQQTQQQLQQIVRDTLTSTLGNAGGRGGAPANSGGDTITGGAPAGGAGGGGGGGRRGGGGG